MGPPTNPVRFRQKQPPADASGSLSNDHRSSNRPAVADHVVD
jgi:hypothetical protein